MKTKRVLWISRIAIVMLLFTTFTPVYGLGSPVSAEGSDVIKISTGEQLARIGKDKPYPQDGHYQLVSDISLANYDNWEPIAEFSGTFDGDWFTISDLTVAKSENTDVQQYNGLFGIIKEDGAVRNLKLVNATVNSNFNAGILAAQVESGNIEYVYATGHVKGRNNVGGIIGYNSEGNISNAHFSGTAEGFSDVSHVGGIAGTTESNQGPYPNYNAGQVSNSSVSGTIKHGYDVGGIAGRVSYSGQVLNSYSVAKVEGGTKNGGIAGYVTLGGKVETSYYDEEISGQTDRDNGFPKSTEDMKKKSTYEEWDFDKTWTINEGATYPELTAFIVTLDGQGTEDNPYLIQRADELNEIRNNPSAHYQLTSDINLAVYDNWEPIADFRGDLDGDGYTISNLTVSNENNIERPNGLFGSIKKGTIHHLKISHANVSESTNQNNYTGVLAGEVQGGNIEYVSISDAVAKGKMNTGGLVGANESGVISYSSFSGSVEGELQRAGGLVGYNAWGTISNSHVTGTVTNGTGKTGGIVGELQGGELDHSYSTAMIKGNGNGLVGELSGDTIVTSSYYDKDVSGKNDTGQGEPKSTAEMKGQETYDGWDFDKDWIMVEGSTYPELRELVLKYRGKGTEADPYLIGNAFQLREMEKNPEAYYQLKNDIDLDVYANWSPIEDFGGTFDGNRYTILNLTIDESEKETVGLFGTIQAGTILNLNVVNANVSGKNDVGIVAGKLEGGKIEFVSAAGSVQVEGNGSTAGGIVGYNVSGDISHSRFSGDIEGGQGTSYTGGIVGLNDDESGIISNSYVSDGNVKNDGRYVGGIAGFNRYGTIENTYSAAKVEGGTSGHGGIVGGPINSVTNSYYNYETSHQSDNDGRGKPETTEQMKQRDTYKDWNFRKDWYIDEGDSYPELRAFMDESDIHEGDSEMNPYLIQDANEFYSILKDNPDAYYVLEADLDLQNVQWDTIETFNGTIDGEGHSLFNVPFSGPTLMFGTIGADGVIKNLHITNEDVDHSKNDLPAALLAQGNEGIIENVTVEGYVAASGLVGINMGEIKDSHFKGQIKGMNLMQGPGAQETPELPDLVPMGAGLVWQNNGLITNSSAEIQVDSNISVGGLVYTNDDNGEITDSYATGTIKTNNKNIASLVTVNGGDITNSYANINFDGESKAGLVAANEGTVTNSYWDNEKSGTDDSAGGIAKTTAEMKQQITFKDWDFTDTWFLIEGQTAPVLKQTNAVNPNLTLSTKETSIPVDDDQEFTMEGNISNLVNGDIAYLMYSIKDEDGNLVKNKNLLKKLEVTDSHQDFSESISLNKLSVGTHQVNVWVKTIKTTGTSETQSLELNIVQEQPEKQLEIEYKLIAGGETYQPGEWTNKSIEINPAFQNDDPSKRKYAIVSAGEEVEDSDWIPYDEDATLELKESGEFDVHLKTNGENEEHKQVLIENLQIDVTPPSTPTITPDTTDWTNKPMEIKIEDSDPGVSGVARTEYKVDDGDWKTYQDAFLIESEGEHDIYARTWDNAGNVTPEEEWGSALVRINKTAPEITVTMESENDSIYQTDTWINSNVKVTAEFSNEETLQSREISLDGGETWEDYTDPVTISDEGVTNVVIKTIDVLGNEATEERIVKIDKTKPEKATITLSDKHWTNEAVTVTITAGEDSGSGASHAAYRLNETDNWSPYEKPLSINKNGKTTVYARTVDKAGNVSPTSTVIVRIEIQDKEITVGKEETVHPGATYTVGDATITMPDDLPVGTTLVVESLKDNAPTHTGLRAAGDIYSFTFHYPDGQKASGNYQLSLGYASDTSTDKLAVYYFNEDTQEWEYRGGDVDGEKQVISLDVPHFSTYGVFADEDAPEVSLNVEKADSNQVHLTFDISDASQITTAELRRDGELIATLTGKETDYTDSTVTPGATYTYSLLVKDQFGNERESDSRVTVPNENESNTDVGSDKENSNDKSASEGGSNQETPDADKVTNDDKLKGPKGEISQKENEQTHTEKADGDVIPKTATFIYNGLLIGFLLIIIGLALWQVRKIKN